MAFPPPRVVWGCPCPSAFQERMEKHKPPDSKANLVKGKFSVGKKPKRRTDETERGLDPTESNFIHPCAKRSNFF